MLSILVFLGKAHGEDILNWRDCVLFTMARNPDLQSSLELIKQNQAAVGVARSAYLPQISANLGLSSTKQITPAHEKYTGVTSTHQLLSAAAQSTTTVTNSYSYGVSGKQLLFDSMKTPYEIKAAECLVDDARYQHVVTSAQVRLNLRVAFVQLLKAQESIAIRREIVNRWKKNLDLVAMRYKAGREHRGSLLNAEANLAQAKYALQQAERGITVAQRNLTTVMGITSYHAVRADGTLTSRLTDRNKPDLKSIVESHPLVMRIIKQGESSRYAEKSRIASFLPVISATGSAGKSDTRWPPGRSDLSAGVEFSMPLFQGGGEYYNLAKTQSESRRLSADEKGIRDQVILSLEEKWNDWQNAIDMVDVQRKFLKAAEERAKIAEAEYAIGLSIFDNWIIIEDQLAQVKQNYLDALANQLITEAYWIQAKGETLAYDK